MLVSGASWLVQHIAIELSFARGCRETYKARWRWECPIFAPLWLPLHNGLQCSLVPRSWDVSGDVCVVSAPGLLHVWDFKYVAFRGEVVNNWQQQSTLFLYPLHHSFTSCTRMSCFSQHFMTNQVDTLFFCRPMNRAQPLPRNATKNE